MRSGAGTTPSRPGGTRSASRRLPDHGDRWIITAANTDVGMLELWWRDHDLYVGAIEITPDSQSLGIGASVLSWVVEEAAKRGQPVSLRVLRSNPRACRFYERHAFQRIGEGEHHFEYRSQSLQKERP
jgi:ribosomal protein S18 acetylase RimI-like enzyme